MDARLLHDPGDNGPAEIGCAHGRQEVALQTSWIVLNAVRVVRTIIWLSHIARYEGRHGPEADRVGGLCEGTGRDATSTGSC